MGREIKFRAWDGEQMVSPDYIDREGVAWWKANSIPTFSTKVMQFTGLKDKNGKEIYEGDILASEGRVIGHIKGGVRGYCYDVVYANPTGDKRWSLYASVTTDYEGRVEVIGNIYENPELLIR